MYLMANFENSSEWSHECMYVFGRNNNSFAFKITLTVSTILICT